MKESWVAQQKIQLCELGSPLKKSATTRKGIDQK